MLKSKATLLKIQYLFLDLIGIQFAYIICTKIMRENFLRMIPSSLKGASFIVSVTAMIAVLFTLFNVYQDDLSKYKTILNKFLTIITLVGLSVCISELMVILLSKNTGMGFLLLVVFTTVYFIFTVTNRILMYLIRKGSYKNNAVKTLILSSSDDTVRYHKYVKINEFMGTDIIGYLSNEPCKMMEACEVKHKGKLASFNELIKGETIDHVVIDQKRTYEDEYREIISTCKERGVSVTAVIEPYIPGFEDWKITFKENIPAIRYSIHHLNYGQLFLKRCLDLFGGSIGFVLFAVMFIIFAPIIKIGSKGPVLFKQDRVGKNGRIFEIYKFRTMCNDAEAKKADLKKHNKMKGQLFKIDNDPRITKIGKFLRKTSIDEFPQFINVLKGDMSLVGTRPPTVSEVKEYEKRHFVRLSMIPGITGMWQANGRSDILDFEAVVKMEKEYIEKWSIWEDIRTIGKTVVVLLLGKGAY